MIKPLFIIIFSLFLTGCSLKSDQIIPNTAINLETSPSPEPFNSEYKATDPIEIFLIELTKAVNISFDNPSKADIFWNEGDSSSTLKVFFGDSFLIKEVNSTLEKEKIVSEYLVNMGFTPMKFNGSIGENSRKMGYRKGDLICKTDFSIYPEETMPHLVVYCSDATKGTLRK